MNDYLCELIYLGTLILFAYIHFLFIKDNFPFSHFKWGLASAGAAAFLFLFMEMLKGEWHWKLPIAFLLERVVFFSPILNKMRHLSFFYRGDIADPHGSKIDQWLGPYYIPVYVVCSVLFIIIQFFLH